VGDERTRVEAETVIIGAAQSGNELAWRQLFAWHFDAVYRFCLALACGRRELAEETAQQAFITAAQQIGRFDRGKTQLLTGAEGHGHDLGADRS